ncbi:MAG: ROK family protein [Massilibacteroides sp.]|nr:ROK family protein [Massilibacteroides sp.]MDD3062981.1 ROK family protein [Massilibacteroides sp.]MDD4116315.1 ROK family protein [Massilibacteroides sp.]
MKNLLGIDIGGTKTAVIYAQELEGNGLKIVDKIVFTTTNVKETLEGISFHFDEIVSRNRLAVKDVSAIGISCGGPLDSKKGIIMSPPNLPDWDHIAIVDMMKERYGIPCAIQNDANACAVAEWKFGAGVGTKNMVFLTFGTGLGAGLILNDKLYCGANDNAGEVGHVRLSKFGPVGYGKQGSFEGFASGGGIAQLAVLKLTELYQQGRRVDWCLSDNIGKVTAQLVAEQAYKGDSLANEILKISATYLGRGLALLIDILNPECIVIGSIYARNVDLFFPIVEKVLKEEALGISLSACRIKPAQLGENIGDYAAVSIASNLINDL